MSFFEVMASLTDLESSLLISVIASLKTVVLSLLNSFRLHGAQTACLTGTILIPDTTFFRLAQHSYAWFNALEAVDDPQFCYQL